MIKVSYCVAYDWHMLRHSLPLVYKQADVICLSIDVNRQSWTGTYFSWDEEGFRKLIKDLDPLNKVSIYEAQFYNPKLSPMENEVAQRNRIAEYLGKDGWHIQLDADEYFIDFEGFVRFLKGFTAPRKVNICCPLINFYKQTPQGILWIKPKYFSQVEYIQIATQYPLYEYGRRNGYFNILTDFSILHQSWARSEPEIFEKLNNWGHARDFDVVKYFQQWKEVNAENYGSYRDFHHLRPGIWPALELKKGSIDALSFESFKQEDFPLPISRWDLLKANSIWFARFNKVVGSILK